MALLTWSDKYSVGVKTLDNQHAGLVETLNELHAAMMKGLGANVTGPLLHRLVAYTRDHFFAEEAMLTSAKYPDLARHCALHRDLTHQVEEFADRFERGEITISIPLMNFLRDWLANHILKEDKAYGPCLNQHGLS